MTTLQPEAEAALAPVREALLATARKTAAQIQEDAQAQAQVLLDAAHGEADRIRAGAAATGESAGRSQAALRSARTRRQAHETVLTQQNNLFLELRREVAESATALRSDPRYPDLLDRLTERARAALGPDATLTESSDGGGIAERGSRRLDLSLPTLALSTLDSLSAEISPLWVST
ncbi:hypothetical protein [Cryobacterium psychrophilum]|uniref:Uncharacterized protein n=1 Tax=Cryobacterium psychrophilum TaxID=41988 RepID=A0A4Y8KPR1_9MICO|nr:hypothetical protein [Cryobacterium psychrophilum]TDW30138.1 vacuolar-type H+-ATPase subunit E/Vma4 [Cryobacterium psychrophilum]TFD80594.1 hypothetical protein E3T53_04595 [Cryobacterium psychrophilum]